MLLVSWCRGDSLTRRAMRSADTMLWALLLVQVRHGAFQAYVFRHTRRECYNSQILSSAVEESSPSLPSALVFYYRIMRMLLGQVGGKKKAGRFS